MESEEIYLGGLAHLVMRSYKFALRLTGDCYLRALDWGGQALPADVLSAEASV